MLKCKEVVNLCSDYIDGELSFGQHLKLKVHLFMCHRCSGFIERFRLAVAVFGKFEQPGISQEEASNITHNTIIKSDVKDSL